MFFDLDLPTLIARIFVLLVAFTVHEFAHAWTANMFGDDTPRMNGRLTLNPVAIVLSVILWGWLWGVPGALLAGPILITVKVLGDNIPSMVSIGEVLGGTAPSPALPRQRVLSE